MIVLTLNRRGWNGVSNSIAVRSHHHVLPRDLTGFLTAPSGYWQMLRTRSPRTSPDKQSRSWKAR